MRKLVLGPIGFCFLALNLLSACSGARPETREERETMAAKEEAAALAEATDECLDNEKLWNSWGDCNVKKAVFDQKGALTSCQKKFSLTQDPRDQIVMNVRVKTDGSVQWVKAASGRPRNLELEGCLTRALQRAKFAPPPQGKSPVVQIPFQR
jgi:hypothetical protein